LWQNWINACQDPSVGEVEFNVTYVTEINVEDHDGYSVVLLEFGSVNHGAHIFINDELVGVHYGPLMPFSVDITKNYLAGETFVLKVVAYVSERASYENKNEEQIEATSIIATPRSKRRNEFYWLLAGRSACRYRFYS